MHGKVVVITGGTSGIGRVAAMRLARMGARMVVLARDRNRGEAVLDQLPPIDGGQPHSLHVGDLSIVSEMKRLAAQIAAAEARIDVLINNAGALFATRELTVDGLERTFATNHMAYFVLTLGLRERLWASAPARVVNTASSAHRGARLCGLAGLRAIEALQHPVLARACAPLGRHRGHGQLIASRFRGNALRRSDRRPARACGAFRQALCHFAGKGRGNDCVPGFLARCRAVERRVLLQVPTGHANGRRTR